MSLYVLVFTTIWLAVIEFQALNTFAMTPSAMYHISRLTQVALRSNYGRLFSHRQNFRSYLSSDSNISGESIDIPKSRKRVVFLGTPSVAADCCLQILSENSFPNLAESDYEIVAVVTQPPAPAGRNKKLTNSAVHDLSLKLGIPVLTPETAKDEIFLSQLESLQTDLCITAAYGNFLPKRFLSIPALGTVNIHPSLLPLYRGAAPVQRCLENGDDVTGVSVAFTVLKMDAGPIIKQVLYPLNGDEKAPQVLKECFKIGTAALIDHLPAIFNKTVQTTIQSDELATAAPKISSNESIIDFRMMSARTIHNKCRAFAEWPGIAADFLVGSDATEPQRIKIITTKVLDSISVEASKLGNVDTSGQMVKTKLLWDKPKGMLIVECGDGSCLGLLELQPVGKKAMDAKSFVNGLRGDVTVHWVDNSPRDSTKDSDNISSKTEVVSVGSSPS